MTASPYARVLFAGPDLVEGSFAELFRRQLVALRGESALADIVDTASGYDALWQVAQGSPRPLLVIDLEPQSSAQHLDWLRSELAALEGPEQVFVASLLGQFDSDPARAACTLIERRELHLDCVNVPALPESHSWSCIPPHARRLLLCNGPRCTRRGALPLWKKLRETLKAAGKLECEGGVHITRTQCQFPCDEGPSASLYPEGEWYRIRDEEEVLRWVQERIVEERQVPEMLMKA
ncbi:(2Fe-2S) ferredoxin domain-containing protein [Pseudomonas sp. BN414]|uniref:(2Fe-2S) ferredoxin domain-containing protein n=1 Tax=Pseudomonas sp. BN414 TaxID=2567888 RepID=UPI002458D78E|nr:(2Fe-2S) ferredoxin domain-containing protein [Pseudomonas sp. BN414]MDH4568517.1 (2Fe-2S) ferredoxin domain-containing protein [Pseudomonas sp. BN414]